MPAVPRLLTVASSVCSDDAAPDPMLDIGGAGGGLGKRPRAWGQVVCVCVWPKLIFVGNCVVSLLDSRIIVLGGQPKHCMNSGPHTLQPPPLPAHSTEGLRGDPHTQESFAPQDKQPSKRTPRLRMRLRIKQRSPQPPLPHGHTPPSQLKRAWRLHLQPCTMANARSVAHRRTRQSFLIAAIHQVSTPSCLHPPPDD
jgi:hypothetical protein